MVVALDRRKHILNPFGQLAIVAQRLYRRLWRRRWDVKPLAVTLHCTNAILYRSSAILVFGPISLVFFDFHHLLGNFGYPDFVLQRLIPQQLLWGEGMVSHLPEGLNFFLQQLLSGLLSLLYLHYSF